MSVKIQGLQKLLSRLEQEYGKARMAGIEDKALKAGAEVFKAELISQFKTFKDTGESIKEMTLTEP